MTRIFISHRHSDEAIADKLLDVLVCALDLNDRDILCTSDPNSGLSFNSNSISDQLKTNLKSAEALIVLITPDSLRSLWIPFEVGSFWPTEKPIILLLGSDLIPDSLPGPLKGWLSICIELPSSRNVKYTKLRDFLAAGNWKEADEETAKVMCQAANLNLSERSCLSVEDIDNFPCTDLRTINQLWLDYSGGKFGFTVQKEIYQRLGGTREYNREIWQAFADEVGWRKGGRWLSYKDITFNTSAPLGHLPMLPLGSSLKGLLSELYVERARVAIRYSSLASRLVKCNISGL